MASSWPGSGIDGTFVPTVQGSSVSTSTNQKEACSPWYNGPRQGKWYARPTSGSFIDDQEVLASSTIASTAQVTGGYYRLKSPSFAKSLTETLVDATTNDRIRDAKRNNVPTVRNNQETVACIYDKLTRSPKRQQARQQPSRLNPSNIPNSNVAKRRVLACQIRDDQRRADSRQMLKKEHRSEARGKRLDSLENPDANLRSTELQPPVPELTLPKAPMIASGRRALRGIRIVGQDGRETFTELPGLWPSKKDGEKHTSKRSEQNVRPNERPKSQTITQESPMIQGFAIPRTRFSAKSDARRELKYRIPSNTLPSLKRQELALEGPSPTSHRSKYTVNGSRVALDSVHDGARARERRSITKYKRRERLVEDGQQCNDDRQPTQAILSAGSDTSSIPKSTAMVSDPDIGRAPASLRQKSETTSYDHRGDVSKTSINKHDSQVSHSTIDPGTTVSCRLDRGWSKQSTYSDRSYLVGSIESLKEKLSNSSQRYAHLSSRPHESSETKEHSFTRMADLEYSDDACLTLRGSKVMTSDGTQCDAAMAEDLPRRYSRHRPDTSNEHNPRLFAGHGWISPHPLSDIEGGKVQSEVTLSVGNESSHDKVKLSFDEWQKTKSSERSLTSGWERSLRQKALHASAVNGPKDRTASFHTSKTEAAARESPSRYESEESRARRFVEESSYYEALWQHSQPQHMKRDDVCDVEAGRQATLGDRVSTMESSTCMPLYQSKVRQSRYSNQFQPNGSQLTYQPPTVESAQSSQDTWTELHRPHLVPPTQPASVPSKFSRTSNTFGRSKSLYTSPKSEEQLSPHVDTEQPSYHEHIYSQRQCSHGKRLYRSKAHNQSPASDTGNCVSHHSPSNTCGYLQMVYRPPTPVLLPMRDVADYMSRMPWDGASGGGPSSKHQHKYTTTPSQFPLEQTPTTQPSATNTYGMSSLDRAEKGHGIFGQLQ
ncbi:hypothetical protein K431DRAFT_98367 [Polychaeton citri CBS 116435]|uniref:Uncharacterized protein n=1 Tax=Polychaeton citri CBS 116435 TaxID=1314669 RepID=A0A9P4QDB5_9PEZI|nr:hypothetical protein K431DRAFT_98367 [Polychaeton citri CBS 116435]